MQLHRDSGDVVERGKGSFIFPISVGARRVPCTVTRDALAIFVSDYDDPRRAFSRSRRMIERILKTPLFQQCVAESETSVRILVVLSQ